MNKLDFAEIQEIRIKHFNSKRFVVRERFRFWTNVKLGPEESIQELAAKIRGAATRLDFPGIDNRGRIGNIFLASSSGIPVGTGMNFAIVNGKLCHQE